MNIITAVDEEGTRLYAQNVGDLGHIDIMTSRADDAVAVTETLAATAVENGMQRFKALRDWEIRPIPRHKDALTVAQCHSFLLQSEKVGRQLKHFQSDLRDPRKTQYNILSRARELRLAAQRLEKSVKDGQWA